MNVKNNFLGTGRIANDLEMKVTASGKHVCNLTLAVQEGTKEKPYATFLQCEAWDGFADTISKYFSKGDQIIIGGHLVNRKVLDRGENRYRTSIVIDGFEFGQKKKKEESKPSQSYTYNDVGDDFGDEDYPW